MTATKGEGAAPAVPHPGDFEEWLDNQRQRQDRTGAVARFVIEDLERGCWPDPTDLFIWYKRTDEEQRQAWVNHLVGKHRMPPRSIEIFCEVHAEYLGACRRWFEWNQAMNAGNRSTSRTGKTATPLTSSGKGLGRRKASRLSSAGRGEGSSFSGGPSPHGSTRATCGT